MMKPLWIFCVLTVITQAIAQNCKNTGVSTLMFPVGGKCQKVKCKVVGPDDPTCNQHKQYCQDTYKSGIECIGVRMSQICHCQYAVPKTNDKCECIRNDGHIQKDVMQECSGDRSQPTDGSTPNHGVSQFKECCERAPERHHNLAAATFQSRCWKI